MSLLEPLLSRLQRREYTRFLAFGSSNTERRIAGMHWFDCVELACRLAAGPHLAFINAGKGGDTTLDLLDRVDRDCLGYRPDYVFLTVGGNDSNPLKNISHAQYRANLQRLIHLIREAGGEPILQTYYAFDLEAITHVPKEIVDLFPVVMEEIRQTAEREGCYLIDHLVRWEALRHQHPTTFRRLLIDPTHVGPTGNLLIGLDIIRHLGLSLPDEPFYHEARHLQTVLDTLVPASIPALP